MDPLSLIAAHVAYPDTTISNSMLFEMVEERVPSSFLEELAISERRSCLDINYIQQTRNIDWWSSLSGLAVTPSQLGAAAAKKALEDAGLEIDQIGLVLSSTLTPLETCPAEATRIASLLDAKVPSYDVMSGGMSFAGMLEVLSSWNPAHLPDYTLCVLTQTPTQYVNFRQKEAFVFGDAAAALIVSRKQSGSFVIEKAEVVNDLSAEPLCSLQIYSSITLQSHKLHDRAKEKSYFIESTESIPGDRAFREVFVASPAQIDREEFMKSPSTIQSKGFAFGASVIGDFVQYRSQMLKADRVAFFGPQVGCERSIVVLHKVAEE
jgi:3-oxoacyl-[acyl-carrier-protein] synthase III